MVVERRASRCDFQRRLLESACLVSRAVAAVLLLALRFGLAGDVAVADFDLEVVAGFDRPSPRGAHLSAALGLFLILAAGSMSRAVNSAGLQPSTRPASTTETVVRRRAGLRSVARGEFSSVIGCFLRNGNVMWVALPHTRG